MSSWISLPTESRIINNLLNCACVFVDGSQARNWVFSWKLVQTAESEYVGRYN